MAMATVTGIEAAGGRVLIDDDGQAVIWDLARLRARRIERPELVSKFGVWRQATDAEAAEALASYAAR